MYKKILPYILLFSAVLSGCAVNPVTGKNELNLVSEATELEMGAKQYAPARQMQGGDYVADPGVAAYVSSVGQRIASVSDRQLPYEFSVINDSTPNAWAMPGGKIAINRGLLTELENEAELAAVLSHEIVHAAARHSAQGMQRGLLLQGAVLAAGVAAGGTGMDDYVVGGAGVAANMLNQKYGRDAERESDYYGMKYMSRAGYDPAAAVSLQETFVRLSEGRNSSWLAGLFSSHPPSRKRVEANRLALQEFPRGGEIARERYRRNIATLLVHKNAYEAYDEGVKALSEGKTGTALEKAQIALSQEPREALFHALRGDVRYQQGRYQDAIINYDRAIERNNDFFLFYLQRGLAREKLGQIDSAHDDLEQSVKRLPTAPALKALGDISQTRGDYAAAKKYYSAAAGSKSPSGKAAAAALVRLDLQDNPHKYLNVRVGLNNDRYLAAQVENTTAETVTDVAVLLQFKDAAGRVRQVQLMVPGNIGPGQKVLVDTGIGPDPQIANVQAAVTRASLAAAN